MRQLLTSITLGLLIAACPAKPKAPNEPTPTKAAPASFLISPENSSIAFVGSKPSRSHEGKFATFSGNIEMSDPKHIEDSSVQVKITMSDFATDEEKLTGHLKSPDFFDVAKFPVATFVSTSVTAGGDNGATHTIKGDLDFHGVKKAISLPAKISISTDVITADSEFTFNRKDFGVMFSGMDQDPIKDEVVIKVNLRATPSPITGKATASLQNSSSR